MFHTYVASVLSECYICLQWFQVFLGVFASVSNTYFKYFICLQTYVGSVASGCFTSRSGVTYVTIRTRSGGDASGPTRGLMVRAAFGWHGHARSADAASTSEG